MPSPFLTKSRFLGRLSSSVLARNLKTSDQSLGLLINFNVRLLRQGVRRVVRTR
jgi:hypothetical protein